MSDKLVSVALADSLLSQRANSLEKREPTKAMLALEMLSGGEKWDAIQEATGFTFNQLSGLRARNEAAIEQRRRELAQDGFEMAEGLRLLIKQKMDSLANNEDALAKVNLRDLALSYGIAVDKGMQALGEAKTVVEHRTGKVSLEDAMKMVQEARDKVAAKIKANAIDAEVV